MILQVKFYKKQCFLKKFQLILKQKFTFDKFFKNKLKEKCLKKIKKVKKKQFKF